MVRFLHLLKKPHLSCGGAGCGEGGILRPSSLTLVTWQQRQQS